METEHDIPEDAKYTYTSKEDLQNAFKNAPVKLFACSGRATPEYEDVIISIAPNLTKLRISEWTCQSSIMEM